MARNLPDHPSVKDPRSTAVAASAMAVAGATFAGSAPALVEVGQRAGLSDPWALPLALGGLAVIAAIVINGRRHDRVAWAALIAVVAVSTWLQAGPPSAGLVAVTVHAVPPIAMGFALVELARSDFDWPPWSTPAPTPVLPAPTPIPTLEPVPDPYRRRYMPVRLRAAIIERDGLICGLCGDGVQREDVHIDHIHPVSLGGSDHPDNLQVTHSTCNLIKGARV